MITIAVTGPESSGKTTLAMALSNALSAVLVNEYARSYLKEKRSGYFPEDLDIIAKRQFNATVAGLSAQSNYLVSDTDMHTMSIWYKEKYGYVSSEIKSLLHKEEFKVYLLCRPDIAWEPDPLRENPNDRERLFNLYFSSLKEYNRCFGIVEGNGASRLENALNILRNKLNCRL
jgi:nicotinamide riboside kinase